MGNPVEELLDAIEEAEAAGHIRMVFWLCPKGCRGLVDWTKGPQGLSIPSCRECSETGVGR